MRELESYTLLNSLTYIRIDMSQINVIEKINKKYSAKKTWLTRKKES